MIDLTWVETVREHELLRKAYLGSTSKLIGGEWRRFHEIDREFANVDIVGQLIKIIDEQAMLIECHEAPDEIGIDE